MGSGSSALPAPPMLRAPAATSGEDAQCGRSISAQTKWGRQRGPPLPRWGRTQICNSGCKSHRQHGGEGPDHAAAHHGAGWGRKSGSCREAAYGDITRGAPGSESCCTGTRGSRRAPQGCSMAPAGRRASRGLQRHSQLSMEMLFGLPPTDAGKQKLCWYTQNVCISPGFSADLAQMGFPVSKDLSTIGSNLLQGSSFGNPNTEQACARCPGVSPHMIPNPPGSHGTLCFQILAEL